MTLDATTLQSTDLTARARIRSAALRLFGRDGVDATSVRAVADEAGVSPGLVIHHFGSKDNLRAAVDDAVIERFRESTDEVRTDQPASLLSVDMGNAMARAIVASPDLRRYVRRALLEATPAGLALFDQLLELVEGGLTRLDEAGGLRAGVDPEWRPYQLLWVILGPLLFEPLMQRHLTDDVFDENVVQRRSAANHDVLSHGMLSS